MMGGLILCGIAAGMAGALCVLLLEVGLILAATAYVGAGMATILVLASGLGSARTG